jgi:hypothetical protein
MVKKIKLKIKNFQNFQNIPKISKNSKKTPAHKFPCG